MDKGIFVWRDLMMKTFLNSKFLLLVFLSVNLVSCSTLRFEPPASYTPPSQAQKKVPRESAKTAPATSVAVQSPQNLLLLDHKYFQVYYDPSIRLARFVKYTVTAEEIENTHVKRKNKFRADPMLQDRQPAMVAPKEYVHSGYDQGHMAPSGDFAWDEDANNETFVLSNMAPQKPNLNRQAWRLLEEQVRKWACGEEKITVFTGPIFSAHPSTLASGLEIPDQFFKIVIDETPPMKTIGFIYNQTDTGNVIEQRMASVDDIEAKSHENFEAELTLQELASFHKTSSLDDWKSVDCAPHKKK